MGRHMFIFKRFNLYQYKFYDDKPRMPGLPAAQDYPAQKQTDTSGSITRTQAQMGQSTGGL